MSKNIVKIVIGFDLEEEEISYIKSDFMDEKNGFKDGVGYTAKLIEMALEYFIRKEIGIFCPKCDNELEEDWVFCPSCGWSADKG